MTDAAAALGEWLPSVSGPEWFWLAKRLSANDTGATESHQVGIYIPKEFAFAIFPALEEKALNPKIPLRLRLDSHDQIGTPTLTFYNNRLITPGGTRNECRITGFGGRSSALQDPENTASAVLLALRSTKDGGEIRGWVSTSIEEDAVLEAQIGELVPGALVMRTTDKAGHVALALVPPPTPAVCECSPAITALAAGWGKAYPSGDEIAREAVRRCPCHGDIADRRLLRRRACEFDLYKVVESAIEMPRIGAFKSIDEFVGVALSILNRRKSRAGGSLELHLSFIFDEEKVAYDRGKETENGNEPDFIFPSIADYHRLAARDPKLHMLASKTSLKDRWRQILREADKISPKHLFTLDEGLSENQFAQIAGADIVLVVPDDNVEKFPKAVRPNLVRLADFVTIVRAK